MPSLDCIQPASCNGCGLCCQGIGSPVVLYTSNPDSWGPHPFRPAALPDDLIREIDDHFLGLHRGQEPQEQCLWYDAATRSCRHYEWRPQVCRDYELGGSECLALRQRHIEGERPREIAADEG
ncbi:MAG: YkgJ family cysteine cluster protein [Planctomycetaceae bacterium]|nr:YkgJ family cysteine cluster protein [Planctomycetaceae bacterium]